MNCLFYDKPTSYRVRIGNVYRVVRARYDHEHNFIRFVVHKTAAEIEKSRQEYLPARVGIQSWFEVHEHNFAKGKA